MRLFPLTKEEYITPFCVGQEYNGGTITAIYRDTLIIDVDTNGTIAQIDLNPDFHLCMLHRRALVLADRMNDVGAPTHYPERLKETLAEIERTQKENK